MRILHIVGGHLKDGAARGAFYLHQALRSDGVDSQLVCPDPNAVGEGLLSLSDTPFGVFQVQTRLIVESLPPRLFPRRRKGIFSLGIAGVNWNAEQAYRAADLIHLHWINRGMLSIAGIGRLDKPCIWTMRDMWPFTGGCHYSLECRKYEADCGACPALGSRLDNDLSRWVLHRKKRQFPSNLTMVGISKWVSDCARKSAVFQNADIRTIENCIDTNSFNPLDKQEARELLGLPADRHIVLHGALNMKHDYKGSILLEQSKIHLPEDIYVCAFGKAADESTGVNRYFGYIDDDELLRTIYSAADALIFPSTQEAFGKVAAESLACGTPVVAFGATGPKDIVRHKRTGYVADPFDPVSLADGVRWLLEDHHRHLEICRRASEDAHRRFSPAAAAKKYMDLYEEKGLLERRRSPRPTK